MRVGAVIVTHAQPGLAARNAELVASVVGRDATVVVVNDAGALDAATEQRLTAVAGTVIVNERFLGYGENLNRGVETLASDREAVLLLNDDAFPEDGAIERMAALLRADPRVGLVGPAVVDPSGAAQPAVFRFPSLLSETIAFVTVPRAVQSALWRRFVLDAPDADGRVDWVLGAAMLARRKAYDEVGGFDPSFFLYSEETDLARRMADRGWAAAHLESAVFEHIGAASGEDPALLASSRARYVDRHWPAWQRRLLPASLWLAHAWNLVYWAARSATNPHTAHDRWRLVWDRRRVRTRQTATGA